MNDIIAEPVEDTAELRDQVIENCLYMRDVLGYFFGTWGNISVRVRDGILLTPSRIPYDKLRTNDLVVVSLEGKVVRGNRIPTSEMLLHIELMKLRKDFGAVVHSHSQYAGIVSCCHQSIPVLIDDMAEVVGGTVNCSKYVSAGEHRQLAQAASENIGNESFAVLLGNHGQVAAGRDLKEAMVCSQAVERAAKIFVLSGAIDTLVPIPEEKWRKERHRIFISTAKVKILRV